MNWFIIIFCIIAISLFIISQYIRLNNEKRKEDMKNNINEIENFEEENALSPSAKLMKYHNITLDFKNSKDAKKLITRNAQYLQNMNQPNLLARGCSSKDELFIKYLDAFDNIQEEEKTNITLFILELLNNIKPRNAQYYNYICYWIKKISIAKAKPWLESGMPHTLEYTIIMDANWFINPRQTTFIHELTHINQRIIAFEFEDLYKDLGYINLEKTLLANNGINNIKGMQSVIALNRNNPDGLSPNWLWYDKGSNIYWWIGAIFQTITPLSLSDVNNVALKLEQGQDGTYYYLKQQPTILDTLDTFNSFFGSNPNNYHPNEMSAKYSEWYYETLMGISNKYDKYKGFNIYKTHFEKLISSYYK